MKPVRTRLGLAVATLTAAATFVAPTPATAAGTSSNQFGCYAQWWNTAAALYCVDVTRDLLVQLSTNCSWSGVHLNGLVEMHRGDTSSPLQRHECRFGAISAHPAFG